MEIFFLVLAALAVIIIVTGVRVVPQQSAYVIERLGKFRVAYMQGSAISFHSSIASPIGIR